MSLKSYLTESDNNYKIQLSKGIKVESEHQDLYNYFEIFLKQYTIKMPLTKEEFFSYISKAHLREKNNYYDLLEDMESKF
jgi:hypothetical protein